MCKTQVRNGGAKVTHVGYARVSTDGQSLDAQVGELEAAGAVRVFQEKISGAVHASNSTSPRFAGSGFSARGFARIRWRATRVTQSASRASFSLVARTGNIAGMRNWLRNVDEIQRVCDHGRTNKPSKRNCSQRSNSTVHRSFAGISRWVDDEFWASQGSFARSPHHRAHRR
jgi:Resolvase, N terminal domain